MATGSLAGQTLGQYELRELVGESGMGAVYRAYQASLQREVAFKVMSASLASQPGYVERFTREARTAAALEHAHIVPVYDYGTQDDISYIVMRLLSGGSLEQRISQGNRLPSLQETSELLDQLASALDYAHRRGVIHRDIKASNVMFDDQGSAFLVDFGIAKLLSGSGGITTTGQIIGTPSYMAPEQWRDEEITEATDLYALGVLVYVTLTGKLPFEASTPHALMHKHLHEPPRPPNVWRPELPDAVKPVLEKALAKNPNERYRSAGAFAQAFKQAVQGIAAGSVAMSERSPACWRKRRASPASPAISPAVDGADGAGKPTVACWRCNPAAALLGVLVLYEDANRRASSMTGTAHAALLAATDTPTRADTLTPTDTLTARVSRTPTAARTPTFRPVKPDPCDNRYRDAHPDSHA
jgi:serine/threonine-protein kinase